MATNELESFLAGRKCRGFTPRPYYCADGDFLTYFFRDEEYIAERYDDVLTVYWSARNGECVGFKLKGVRALWSMLGDYEIAAAAENEEFRLNLFVLAGLQLTDSPTAFRVYQTLVRQTKGIRIPMREFNFAAA